MEGCDPRCPMATRPDPHVPTRQEGGLRHPRKTAGECGNARERERVLATFAWDGYYRSPTIGSRYEWDEEDEETGMGARRRTPRDLLTPAALHILMAVASRPLHGLGIKDDVEERTGGRLRLGPGTLYEAIHRMEADGWIAEVRDHPDAEGKRRVYRLTPAGRRRMEEELRRLEAVVRYARDHALLPDRGAP